MISLKDFEKNQVYKMSQGYYIKKPYYIYIKEVGKDYIVTDIPSYHSVKITFPSSTWDYQIGRMTFMGYKNKCKNLLYNQKLMSLEDIDEYWEHRRS
jgi:hypothetical protein